MTEAVKPPAQDLGAITVMARAVSPTESTREDRVKTANLVNQKITNDTTGHINTQMQLLPMIGALIGGNLKEAYNAYNGGVTRVEDAIHPTLGRFQREYNSRGPTGRIFDQNGKELDANRIQELDKAGGLIGNSDRTAFDTGAFQAASANQKMFMTGLALPVAEQYAKSAETAKIGSTLRNALETQRRLVADKELAPVLETIAGLPALDRQKLFGFVSAQAGTTSGRATQETESGSANVLQGQNVQGTVGGKAGVGLDLGGPGSIPGAVNPRGFGVSGSRTAGGMNQVGVTGATGLETGRTSGVSDTISKDVLSEISRITQGAIRTPQQFTALQSLVQTTDLLNNALATMKPQDMAPGAKALSASINPLLNSRADVIAHSIDFQRNNALNVAYNSFLARQMHSNINNINPEAIDQLKDKFLSSQTFKAINRTYDYELQRAQGKKPEREEGALYIDRNNRLRKWVNDDWEPVNAR